MGMWGTGVFANDSALDFLDEMVNTLAKGISAALGMELHDHQLIESKPLAGVEIFELDHRVLPSVAILIRLCANPVTELGPQTHLPLNGGLLERVDTDSVGGHLPESDDPRWPDPVLAWTATPPPASIVRSWRERALAAFSANVRSESTSADYREERPAVIKLAFDRLEALAAEAEFLA